MELGIAFPSRMDAWRDCEVAEANGFKQAWFYDTQLLCSDVYATMALAAEHTTTLQLGTLVAVPSNRIAPVTAAALASLNAIAPGRIIFGVGTGFTARNTMGMPPVPVAHMVEYIEQVRGLLAGEDVLYREGKYERWIRLLTTDRKYNAFNLDDPIPIHVAATAPKAMEATGQVGDGWITIALPPDAVRACADTVQAAADRHGRKMDGPEGRPITTYLGTGCILGNGEDLTSPRVMDRVGPVVVVSAHATWEAARGGMGFGLEDEAGAKAFGEYIDAYAEKRGSPTDRRYLDVHEGHMIYLKQGEEQFVDPNMIPFLSLTGHPEEVLEQVRALAEAGVDRLALQAMPGSGPELIEEFSKHVLAKL